MQTSRAVLGQSEAVAQAGDSKHDLLAVPLHHSVGNLVSRVSSCQRCFGRVRTAGETLPAQVELSIEGESSAIELAIRVANAHEEAERLATACYSRHRA